ncbi:MAG: hypothetical protein ABSG36_10965 [Acidimicrobiales bacterium]|jgi:hypothetical protein
MIADRQPPGENAGSLGAATSATRPWYRRRALLVGLCTIVVLAVTVISDLPVHGSNAANISAGKGVMTEINTDIAPCAFAAQESFEIRARQLAGSLTAADRQQAPGLLRQDLAACSFTDDSIYELSSIEVPGSTAGKRLGDLVTTATEWATSDALGAIGDLETLLTHPSNKSAKRDLAVRERTLAADRAAARGDVSAADQILGTRLEEPDMPALPV